MKEDKLENLFLHSKPSNILVAMLDERKYASILSKEVDCTYSHTVRILQEMHKYNLVGFEKKGRIKLVNLTKKGEEIARNMNQLMKSFKSLEKNE